MIAFLWLITLQNSPAKIGLAAHCGDHSALVKLSSACLCLEVDPQRRHFSGLSIYSFNMPLIGCLVYGHGGSSLPSHRLDVYRICVYLAALHDHQFKPLERVPGSHSKPPVIWAQVVSNAAP